MAGLRVASASLVSPRSLTAGEKMGATAQGRGRGAAIVVRSTLALTVAGACAVPAIAQTPMQFEWETISPPSGAVRYGECIAMDGEWTMVGDLGLAEVLVYRLEASGWTEVQTLRGPYGSYFGSTSIDIDATSGIAVVGARQWGGAGNATGRAMVYELRGDAWVWTAGLSVPGLLNKDFFGHQVEVEGRVIVVSAPGVDTPHINSGRIFVFEKLSGTWSQTASLMDDTLGVGMVGGVLDFHGRTLVSTAFEWDASSNWWDPSSGGVLVLERGSDGAWARTAFLQEPAPLGGGLDLFPGSLSLSPDAKTLAAGDAGDYGHGVRGEVYVWERDPAGGWRWAGYLTASDPPGDPDRFGASGLVLTDAAVLVGNRSANGDGSREGCTYVFERDASGLWPAHENSRLVVSADGAAVFGYGYALAEAGGLILMGRDPGPGDVHQYALPIGSAFCDASPNSTGRPANLSLVGSVQVAANSATIVVKGSPPDSLSVFLGSSTRHPPIPYGGGTLCVGRELVRVGGPTHASSDGSVYAALDLEAHSLAAIVIPGTTACFQLWYYDDVRQEGNLSNGIAVGFR